VRDAALMRRTNGVRKRDRDLQQAVERHAIVRHELGYGLPVHQLHRQKHDTFVFFHRVDGDDVGVVERGDGARLAFEAAAALGVGGERGREHLERHLAS
jgi:hypothetical protein